MEPEDVAPAAVTDSSPTPVGEQPSYPPPVQRLFEYAEADDIADAKRWPDYRKLGIGPEHIPDLIHVAQGWRRHWFDEEETPAVWAHVHAWRALGQLGAVEAIEPLLGVMTDMQAEGDDWSMEEIPVVLAQIGPASIEPIEAYLKSTGPDSFSKSAVAASLVKIAKRLPEYRDRAVGILTDALSRYATQEPVLNGLLLGELLELRATEAVPVIREAFRADKIDETAAGGWGDVRRELRIERQPDDPPERKVADAWRERYPELSGIAALTGRPPARIAPTGPYRSIEQRKDAERKRRKRQKQARRQNRKRR